MRLTAPSSFTLVGVLQLLVLAGCDYSERSTAQQPQPTPDKQIVVFTKPGVDIGNAVPPAPGSPAAAAAPACNTRDPIDGLPVDPAIPAIPAVVDVIDPPMIVMIGVSSAENAKLVQAQPEKYAAAAFHNLVARKDTDTPMRH